MDVNNPNLSKCEALYDFIQNPCIENKVSEKVVSIVIVNLDKTNITM